MHRVHVESKTSKRWVGDGMVIAARIRGLVTSGAGSAYCLNLRISKAENNVTWADCPHIMIVGVVGGIVRKPWRPNRLSEQSVWPPVEAHPPVIHGVPQTSLTCKLVKSISECCGAHRKNPLAMSPLGINKVWFF